MTHADRDAAPSTADAKHLAGDEARPAAVTAVGSTPRGEEPEPARSGIFISYRRQDSAGSTGRLADALGKRFRRRRIFFAPEAIEPGADFVEAIEGALASCAVLLAVIGPRWLKVTGDDGRRRLDDPQDITRMEIALALRREPKVRVIPVLVEGAALPRAEELPDALAPLTRHQAVELSEKRWSFDLRRLTRAIDEALPPLIPPRAGAAASAALVAAACAAIALFPVLAGAGLSRPSFLAIVGAAGIGAAVLLERALWHWGFRTWVLRLAVSAGIPLAILAAGAEASRDLRLVVNAVAEDGQPLADGRVKVELGPESWTADLSSGAAVFDSIPRHLGSRPLSLSVEIPGHELAEEAPRALPADGTLTVRLRSTPPPLTQVNGMVVDFEDQPVRGAVVDFDGLAQVVTDEHGRFEAMLTSPPRSTVRVTVRHGGKVRHEDDYTVPNDLTLRFRRR